MATRKPLPIFFFFFFFFSFLFPLVSTLTQQICPEKACHRAGPVIRFPFRLKDDLQPQSCGYPGFTVSCDSSNRTILNLPKSGNFTVHAIDYIKQEILINDPSNCLPARLLSLNLAASPFTGLYGEAFSLFNCSFDYSQYAIPIPCLSGINYTVFAIPREQTYATFFYCNLVKTIVVPIQRDSYYKLSISNLSDDLQLGWDVPVCRGCESRGERCTFNTDFGFGVRCIGRPKHGIPKGAAISMGIGLPIIISIAGLALFIYMRRINTTNTQRPNTISEFTVTPGLDEPTIASFPKVILGESRRLPKPDYNTCPICLSEYRPKETLRSIPQCQHCFHADCIDEWLRQNPTCPVCRNSPERSLPEV